VILALLFPILATAGGVHVVEVRGSINPGSAAYVLESLAASRDASLFVIELDTPGGLLSSARSLIQGISESPVPVAVWVTPSGASATSAGALIALSADVIALHDGANIGAAHPVGGSGEDIKGAMGEKVLNDTAALARAQAAKHGRNVEAAEAFVVHSRSFSAGEAVEKHLADFVVDDLGSLVRRLDGRVIRGVAVHGGDVIRHAMTPKQKFLNFVADPNVSAALLSLGGLAIWAEVSSGFSSIAAGVVGVFCFVLGLVSLQTLPVTTGGEIFLLLGFALLVADALVVNHGLLSVAALVSLTLGALFLIDPGSGSMHVSLSLLVPLVLGLGLVLGLVGYVVSRDRAAVRPGNSLEGLPARVSTVDADGRSGTAYVQGELWRFESVTEVRAGDQLEVSSAKDLKLQLSRRT
jgi:membrane-bound serine protease (ClpP class)